MKPDFLCGLGDSVGEGTVGEGGSTAGNRVPVEPARRVEWCPPGLPCLVRGHSLP